MDETTLFQRTLIALGATILGPLFVATTGVGGQGASVNERIQDYVSVAVATNDQSDEETTDETSDGQQGENGEQTNGEGGNRENESEATPDGYAAAKDAGTYTVKEGDTYGCIAETYYGSYDQWSRVYATNAGWPGFDEYRLDVGAVLQMPAVTQAEALPTTSLCD